MNEPYPITPANQSPINHRQSVEFRGKGSEYFKIWFTNVLLTIVTLGIYSAWAKVRRLKYFSNNTFLDNRSFAFEGDPLNILMGRLIMVIILAALTVLAHLAPEAEQGVWALMFVGLMPMAVIASLKFRLRNTKYRGIRFNFTGKYRAAFFIYSLPYIGLALLIFLGVQVSAFLVTLSVVIGVMSLPMILFYQVRYTVDHAWYGDQKFEFEGDLTAFYKETRVFFGLVAIAVLMFGGVLGKVLVPVGLVLLIVQALLGWVYIDLKMRNLMYNHLHLIDMCTESTMTLGAYYWLNVKNAFLTNITFGLYRPFAMVSIARYKAKATQVVLTDCLSEVIQDSTRQRSAIGEEAADTLFDVDVSL